MQYALHYLYAISIYNIYIYMNYIITNMDCLLCQGLISYVSGTILEGNHNITEPSIYPSVGIEFILRICQNIPIHTDRF